MQFLRKDTRSKISTFNTAPDQVSLADSGFVKVPNEWYNCTVQDCNQQSSVCKKKCGQLASWLSCMITQMQQYLNHPSAAISINFAIDHGTAALIYGGKYWGVPGWDLIINHTLQNYSQSTGEIIGKNILSKITGEVTQFEMHVQVSLYGDRVLDQHFWKSWMQSIAEKCPSFKWLAYRIGDGVLSRDPLVSLYRTRNRDPTITFKISVVMLTDYMYS